MVEDKLDLLMVATVAGGWNYKIKFKEDTKKKKRARHRYLLKINNCCY